MKIRNILGIMIGLVLMSGTVILSFSQTEEFSDSTSTITSSTTGIEIIPSDTDEIKPIGRTVPPFLFEIPPGTVDGVRYTSVHEGGIPESKIQKSDAITLPIIIRPTVDKEIKIDFSTTYGKQRDIPVMPPGLDVRIEPSTLILIPGQNSQINLIIQSDDKALDGKYLQYIIGDWGDPNLFTASGVILEVGKGSTQFLTPWSIEQ